ncbi:hypothetical protein LTR95_015174, partial [Oleoguttula sp. CCFEE 5521]
MADPEVKSADVPAEGGEPKISKRQADKDAKKAAAKAKKEASKAAAPAPKPVSN